MDVSLHSLGLLILFASAYVGVLYTPYCTRYARDTESGCVRRTVAISFVTCGICAWTWLQGLGNSEPPTWSLLRTFVQGVCMTIVIYIPTLMKRAYLGYLRHGADFVEIVRFTGSHFVDLEGCFAVRNYIHGPVTEELVFRYAAVQALLSMEQGWPVVTIPLSETHVVVVLPSLLFALAHGHHCYRVLRFEKQGEGMDITPAILSTLFQMVYTLLFGMYAGWLYIRLGSVLAPIGAHVTCNILGLPDLSFLEEYPDRTVRVLLITSTVFSILVFILFLFRV